MSMDGLEEAINYYIPRMDGWSTPEKCYKLARLIKDHKVQTSVELGIFGGRALISMAFAHRHTGGDTFGCDPWCAHASLEGQNALANDDYWANIDYYNIYKSFIHHVVMHNLLDHCRWDRIKSEIAVRLFDDESIGLLHQDSNHSEQVSCDEIERWDRKISPNGWWIMDDTHWETTKKAQNLLLDKGYEEIEDHKEWKVYRKTIK